MIFTKLLKVNNKNPNG